MQVTLMALIASSCLVLIMIMIRKGRHHMCGRQLGTHAAGSCSGTRLCHTSITARDDGFRISLSLIHSLGRGSSLSAMLALLQPETMSQRQGQRQRRHKRS